MEEIDKALRQKGLSDAAASRLAVGHPSLIKNFRLPSKEDKRYNFTALSKLAGVLELELYFGPPRTAAAILPLADAPEPEPPAPLFSAFTPDMLMPSRGYAKCSLQGYLENEKDERDLPAPGNIREIDADAFYVIAKGPSMIPEGIREGDTCLVSPRRPLKPGDRIWLKDRGGKACIKRLVEETDKTYKLQGWQGPAHGRQTNYIDEWMKSYIAEKGVVLSVWREKPDVAKQPEPVPDPKAERQEADIKALKDGERKGDPDSAAVDPYRGKTAEKIAPPPGLAANDLLIHGGLAAVKVDDDSMKPVYNEGDTLYIYRDDPLRHIPDQLIGLDCIVTLKGEDTSSLYIKRLRRADNGRKGFYNLEPVNYDSPPLSDREVETVLPIRYIKRKVTPDGKK